ncbi:MAG: family transposase, partial [Lacunisphaera sp.]|nr:family transposase [Lacunisphaera sp.]
GISRKTGYKWWRRYEDDPRNGLDWRSHRPREVRQWPERWRRWLLNWRKQRPTWGAILLHDKLRRRWPRRHPPSVRTLQRWLTAAGVTRKRRHRSKRGPRHARLNHLVAKRANDVWTIDFKGPMTSRRRRKIEPLTVFDLASRYGLLARQLAAKDYACTRAAVWTLFKKHGLPRAIQVDNGPPFGSEGPLGLTRLTAEWALLGIQVQFGRPACPQDNPEHERWHRTLQGDVTHFPAKPGEKWQAKLDRFLRIYNTDRAHRALGLRRPCELYRASRRRYRGTPPPHRYPAHWTRLRLNLNGYLWWRKKARLVGAAFGHQFLGLRPMEPGQCEVYCHHLLLGVLVATDRAGMRPVQLHSAHSSIPGGEGFALPCTPPIIYNLQTNTPSQKV